MNDSCKQTQYEAGQSDPGNHLRTSATAWIGLKVGLPGAKEGLQARDVTLAQLLKAQGYMTAQFGKNHLGDGDETLPTAHGFDEFLGSLYHLNAEQEPENVDYFKDPAMRKKYGTRGVIHTWAN